MWIWRKEVVARNVHDQNSGTRWSPLLGRLLDPLQDFARRGVPAERLFGKQLAPVDFDLKDAPGGLNQPHFSLRVRPADLGRQTGGPGLVVSNDAVFNRHAHAVQ